MVSSIRIVNFPVGQIATLYTVLTVSDMTLLHQVGTYPGSSGQEHLRVRWQDGNFDRRETNERSES